jgi:hypothetical protein
MKNTILNEDQSQLAGMARQWAENYPDIYAQAQALAGRIVQKLTHHPIDPRTIYWHRFDSAGSSPRTFSGWEHSSRPIESMTLVQLVMRRFAARDQESLDFLETLSGFYTAGPDHSVFDERNEVKMLVQDVAREFWAADFASAYTQQVTRFWASQSSHFLVLARAAFAASVAAAVKRGELSEEQLHLVRQGLAGRLKAGVNVKTLSADSTPASGISVRAFDLAGHVARDIIRVVDSHGRQVLYLPGAQPALRGFDDASELYDWLRACAGDARQRQALIAHFSNGNELDGSAARPLHAVLDQLKADTHESSLHLVNQQDQVIEGDAFVYLRDNARSEMKQQASTLLTSNDDLRKRIWVNDLGAFLHVGGALAPLAWPIALLVVGASLTRIILNAQIAGSTHDPQERKQAIYSTIADAIQAALTAPLIFVGGEAAAEDFEVAGISAEERAPDPEGSQEPMLAPPRATLILRAGGYWNSLGMIERTDLNTLYRVAEMPRGGDPQRALLEGFAETQRFDYATKMLVGPVLRTFGSPRGALEFAQAAFDGPFVLYEIDGSGLSAVSLRENLQFNTDFTLSRERYPENFVEQRLSAGRSLDEFANEGWRYDEVHVQHTGLDISRIRLVSPAELEQLSAPPMAWSSGEQGSILQGVKVRRPGGMSFLTQYSIEVEGYPQAVRYDPWTATWRTQAGKAYRLDSQTWQFLRVTEPLDATVIGQQEMIEALQQLGIDVRFPLQVDPLPSALARPIPRVIHNIWIGGRMPRKFVSRVISNARLAAEGGNPFKTRLHLSIEDPIALDSTLRRLARGEVESLEVVKLEQTDFYREFAQTPQHEQYIAASTGEGTNYASAVDVLRYPLLNREGGIYLDVDDMILPPRTDQAAFGDHPFEVAPGQLLLNNLVCHRRMAMVMDFNTSNFGSLPDNPLLARISQESLQRYQANPSLYTVRPYEYFNSSAELDQYARRISATTGPGVFNDVIDRQLPAFRQFRAMNRLASGEIYLTPRQLRELKLQVSRWVARYSPLGGLIRIGTTASWLNTR